MVTLYTDSLHRIAYATDASAYREIPMAVAYPRDEEDIRWLMDEARRRHTHLIPRAGGTSIAGQVVGSGIVVDVSRYMNRILEINADQRWVRVQPGVVLDELNQALRPYGLFFSPETSTSNRCCIGGMVGNNSCGTHSLIYGATRDHVLDLKYLLAPGVREEDLRAQLLAWKQDPAMRQRITNAFPDTTLRRRSCGYALDEAIEGDDINLTKLICGSEGTLCFVTEITLSLDPLPPAHRWVECAFLDRLDDAWEANLRALQRHPVAVELIDGKILQLAASNIQASRDMEVLHLDGNNLPAAILVSEFRGDELPTETNPSASLTLYDSDVDKVWALRKAGLGVLTSMPGDAKPVGVIEDTAVAPQRLGAYMHDFQAMMQQLGLDCVYYGHISTGELHLRPILNLKDAHDLQRFRQVAEQTARLVHKHHGSLSGEHGDGRLRGEFIPLMYGDEVYDLFRQIKHTWDPEGIFNRGKIVDTPPMDTFLRTEVGQPTSDLLRRVERCNGAGVCRKSIRMGGTMCPSYKVSGDELMSTRARANALREYLTHPDSVSFEGKDGIGSILASCLACKGCRSECPSNVDMTALRSEVLQQYYDRHGVPFRTWMVAHMAWVERIGSLVPTIYNWFARTQWTSRLIKRVMRFASERSIPTLSRHSLRWYIRRMPKTQPKHGRVYLFADEFTCYQEAELGLYFAQLLTTLGYEVVVPRHVESGRAAISKGCLRLATRYARRNVQLLAPLISEETPLVGIEPSCILSFRDEYPRLLASSPLAAQSTALVANCLLFDEFLVREMHKGHITSDAFASCSSIYLHGHCHQKALVGVEKTAECLRSLLHADVHVIPSGCCGMAGSFGYEAAHYATSMAIGEQVLFPAIRQAQQAFVAAPGTSCRQHILDGTGVTALHPIEILYRALTFNN